MFDAVAEDVFDTEDICEEPTYEFDYFKSDLRLLAKYYIDLFFEGKQHYVGGSIPKSVLYSARNTGMVLNLDISNGMHKVYSLLKNGSFLEEEEESSRKVPEDIRYAIGLFAECAKSGIPKCFAVGIIIMYLELCEGYRITT